MLSLTEKLPQAQNKKDSNNPISIVTVFFFQLFAILRFSVNELSCFYYKFADFLQYRVIFLMYGQCQGGRQIHRTDSNNGFPVYDISAFCKVKRSFMTTQNMTQLLLLFPGIPLYLHIN